MVRTRRELCWACMDAMFDAGMEEVAALREHLRAVVERAVRRRRRLHPAEFPAYLTKRHLCARTRTADVARGGPGDGGRVFANEN